MRIYLNPFTGVLSVYNDVAHTPTVLGAPTAILTTFNVGNNHVRVVAAGMKLRSTASFSNEAGLMTSYVSMLTGLQANYDIYKDHPFQHIYSKGQVAQVRYLPWGYNFLDFAPPGDSVANYTMGFMVEGAPAQTFMLQYVFTVEVLGHTNTDLLPHRMVDRGDPTEVVRKVGHNNPAKPHEWTWRDVGRTVSDTGLGALKGYLLSGGNPIATAIGALGGASGSGYFQSQNSQPSGNLAITN